MAEQMGVEHLVAPGKESVVAGFRRMLEHCALDPRADDEPMDVIMIGVMHSRADEVREIVVRGLAGSFDCSWIEPPGGEGDDVRPR